MGRITLNALVFQLGWFCCVLYGWPLALVYLCCALALHFLFIVEKSQRLSEAILIVAVVTVGWFVDTLFIVSGVLILPDVFMLPPFWLLALWVLFATTLRYCLAWLENAYLLAALLGAVCGPLNYIAGAKLAGGAITTPLFHSVFIMTLVWLAVLPLLMLLAKKIPLLLQNFGLESAGISD